MSFKHTEVLDTLDDQDIGMSFKHWTAVKNILKYLRNTSEMLLIYGGQTELVARGYTDASFQTDHDDL